MATEDSEGCLSGPIRNGTGYRDYETAGTGGMLVLSGNDVSVDGGNDVPRLWFDSDLNSMLYLDRFRMLDDVPPQVVVVHGDERRTLGCLSLEEKCGELHTLPVIFNLSDAGINHLGPYTVYIGDTPFFRREQCDVVYVSETGEVCGMKEACSAVFANHLKPLIGKKSTPYGQRRGFKTLDWVEMRRLSFVNRDFSPAEIREGGSSVNAAFLHAGTIRPTSEGVGISQTYDSVRWIML